MFNQSGIKDVKHRGLINLLHNSFVIRAYAEEPTTNTVDESGDSTSQVIVNSAEDSGATNIPQFNFEQLIAQARKEEKEKLYPEIIKLKNDLKTMTTNNNNNLLEIARLKNTLETYKTKGESEEVAKLKEELKKVKEDFAAYKKNTVSEEELRKTLEAEYEVKNYLSEQKNMNKDKILPMFLDAVVGNTKEEIDVSIKKAIEMTEQVKEQLNVQNPVNQTNTPPITTPSGGYSKKTFNFEAVRNMDVRSPEYAEWRKAQGFKFR